MSGQLTSLGLKKVKSQPGRHSDGDGLYILVGKNLSSSWVLRIQAGGRRQDIGLGSGKHISLSEARKRAAETRNAILAGEQPPLSWRVSTALTETPMTFREAAEACHGWSQRPWKNEKHRDQWINTLRVYAFPALGALPVATITARTVIEALKPIWHEKPETARRVRQRVCTVLNWANAHGYRELEAPSHAIKHGLGVQRGNKGNFAAMHFAEVPAFIAKLRAKQAAGSVALLFLIHTAVRSGEVRGATWDEINLDTALWTIPPERMKAGKEHVVPLSEPALAILREAHKGRTGKQGELVFPGSRGGKLSDMTMSKALRAIYTDKATVHGFRTSFRTWVALKLPTVPDHVAEAALAHTDRNKVQRVYLRTDFLDQRRPVMNAWGSFLQSAIVAEPSGALASNA